MVKSEVIFIGVICSLSAVCSLFVDMESDAVLCAVGCFFYG